MSDFYDADCAEGEPRGRKPPDGPQEVVSSAHPDCPGGAVPRQRTRLGRGGTMRCPVAWTWLHGRTEGQGPRGAAQVCVAGGATLPPHRLGRVRLARRPGHGSLP